MGEEDDKDERGSEAWCSCAVLSVLVWVPELQKHAKEERDVESLECTIRLFRTDENIIFLPLSFFHCKKQLFCVCVHP